jgi:hypothetical protein
MIDDVILILIINMKTLYKWLLPHWLILTKAGATSTKCNTQYPAITTADAIFNSAAAAALSTSYEIEVPIIHDSHYFFTTS